MLGLDHLQDLAGVMDVHLINKSSQCVCVCVLTWEVGLREAGDRLRAA